MNQIRIVSDGSTRYTKVWKNGEEISPSTMHLYISPNVQTFTVDGVEEELQHMVIDGIYTIISGGTYQNTTIMINGEIVHGIKSLLVTFNVDWELVEYNFTGLLLPNLVEFEKKCEQDGLFSNA